MGFFNLKKNIEDLGSDITGTRSDLSVIEDNFSAGKDFIKASSIPNDSITTDKIHSNTITQEKIYGGGITPTGTILPFASETPPAGWLLCDGSTISRANYPDLFAVCGETYGSGDGSTTFTIPDLADRIPVGKGSTKTSLGDKGGDVSGTPSGTLSGGGVDDTTITTSTMPNHDHQEHNQIWMNAAPSLGGAHYVSRVVGGNFMTVTSTGGGARANFNTGGMGGGSAHGHTYHNPSFNGDIMSVEQPYTVLNYIIKY